MAKSVIIGRVSIRVWPDTSQFRKTLEAELKTATKDVAAIVDVDFDTVQMAKTLRERIRELNAAIKGAKGFSVVVSTSIENTNETFRDLKRSIKEVQAAADLDKVDIKTQVASPRLGGLKAPTLLVRPQVDQSGWNDFREALARFDDRVTLRPTVDRRYLDTAKTMLTRALVANGKIPIQIEPDKGSVISTRERIRTALAQAAVTIKVKADHYRAKAEAARLKKIMGDFELDIKPNLRAARVNLIKRQLQVLFGEVDVRIKTILSKESIAVAKTALAAAFRTTSVKVKTVLDSKSYAAVSGALARLTGGRLLKQVFAIDALKDLDLALPKIGLLSIGIGNLSAAALAATGSTLALGRSLVEMGAGAIALPGIFAGLTTMAVSFGMAISETNKVLPELKTGLRAIKEANSEAFWSVAKNDLREFTMKWIPLFQEGMGIVSKASGSAFVSLLKNLRSIVESRLTTWFSAVAKGLNNFVAVGGSTGLANIIRGFGDLGAIYLPRFMSWLGQITTSFGAWITGAVNSGEAMKWVETSIVQLRAFWDVLTNTVGIFDGLSKAAYAAGATGLRGLADNLAAINAAIAQPIFQQGMIWALQGAYGAMQQISTLAGPALSQMFLNLSLTLNSLLPIIGKAGGLLLQAIAGIVGNPALATGLTNMFNGINQALVTLMPVIDQMGIGLGGLATLIGTAFASFGPIVAVAFESAGNAANGLLAALDTVIPVLSGGLLAVLEAVRPAIEQLTPVMSALVVTIGTSLGNAMKELAPSIGTLMSGLVPLFTALANVIGPIIQQLITGLTPILEVVFTYLGIIAQYLTPLVTIVGGILSTVLGIVLGALGTMVSAVMPALSDAIANLVSALAPVLSGIQGFLNAVAPALTAFLGWLFTAIALAIPGIINGVADVVRGVTNVIMGIVTVFQGIFTGNWTMIWDGVKQILSGVWDAIKGIVEIALNVGVLGIVRKGWGLLKGLFENGVAFVSSLWGSGWKAIGDAFSVIWNSIKNLTGTVWKSITGFFSTGMNLIKTGWEGLWLGVKIAFETAWRNLTGFISNGVSGIVKTFTELPGRIVGALGNLGNLLVNSGKSMLDGLARGIRQGIDGAIGAATNALDAVRRLFPFSPAKEGPFSGKGWVLYSGLSIAEALGAGITKGSSVPRKAALAMASDTRDALGVAATASSSTLDRAKAAGISIASSGGDTYEINLNVRADEIGEVADLIERIKSERQRRRQKGGR